MSQHPPSGAMPSGMEKQPISLLEKICGYLKEPSLTRENLHNRVPLKNRFDRTKPEETNIYVEKKNVYWLEILHMCRKLRADINGLRDKAVLDVMFVPNVGLFPTWIVPPRSGKPQPLRIVVRIARFEDNLFPSEWVKAALHKPVQGDEKGLHRTLWSLFTVFTIFIAGRLRFLRHPSRENCNFVRAVYREEPAYRLSEVHIKFEEVDYYPASGKVVVQEIEKQHVEWNQMRMREDASTFGSDEKQHVARNPMQICEDATPFGRAIFEKPLKRESSASESRAGPVAPTRGPHSTYSYQLATEVFEVYFDFLCNQLTYCDEYSNTATTYMSKVFVSHPQITPVVKNGYLDDDRLGRKRVVHNSSTFRGREDSTGVEERLYWCRHLKYRRDDKPDPSDGEELGDNGRAEFYRGLRRDNRRRKKRHDDAKDAEADDNQRVAKRMKELTLDDRVGTC